MIFHCACHGQKEAERSANSRILSMAFTISPHKDYYCFYFAAFRIEFVHQYGCDVTAMTTINRMNEKIKINIETGIKKASVLC